MLALAVVVAAVIIAAGLVFHGLCLLTLGGSAETPAAPVVELVRKMRPRRRSDDDQAPSLPIGL